MQMRPLRAESRTALIRAESATGLRPTGYQRYPPRVFFSVRNAAMTLSMHSLRCDLWPDHHVHVHVATAVPSPADISAGAGVGVGVGADTGGVVTLSHRRGDCVILEIVVPVSDLNDCTIAVSLAGFHPTRKWTHCSLRIE
jgi:hypothetical protein